jgi:predicted secreted Zn-dependent protease
MQDHLERAIALARMGRRAAARDLLRVVLQRDPNNVVAWKWYASLAEDRREAAAAIHNALRIDPGDAWALQAMAQLTAASPPESRPRRRAGCTPAVQVALLVVVLLVGGLLLLTLSTFAGGLESLLVAAPGPAPTGPLSAFQQPPTVVLELPPVSSTPPPTPTTPPPQPTSPPPAPPSSVNITSDVSYYTVQGGSEEELRQQLYALGPYSERLGERVLATTGYEMSVDWTMNEAAGQCSLSEAEVALDLEYIYPRWEPPPDVAEDLIIKWNDFITRVAEHEKQHGQIATDCAHQLAAAVVALPPQPDCDTLTGSVRTAVDEMYAACDARQLQFDEEEGGDTFP